jgi:hypothetical protein
MSRPAWWLDQDDEDDNRLVQKETTMSAENLRAVCAPYAGEPFKITGSRETNGISVVVLCYTKKPFDEALLEGFRKVGWRDVKYRNVRNRKTGDIE